MNAIYNELDAYAAQWLRNLVAAGHVAAGVIDERSISEVTPDDVRTATQAHFFAGIGIWSHALRAAAWPDDAPVWTGSCPCQPFSAAGLGGGFDDPRHLWPVWFRLIDECRPPVVLGEQVASPAGLAWLDAVFADLEGAGYACGAVDSCAAGFGSPHIRQRIYWCAIRVADTNGVDGRLPARREWQSLPEDFRRGEALGLGHTDSLGAGWDGRAGSRAQEGARLRPVGDGAGASGAARGLGDTDHARLEGREPGSGGGSECAAGPSALAVEWLPCRDGKHRPTQPGLRPLVDGASGRVGRLRAYGNGLDARQATGFVRAVMASLAVAS